jgi:hypothetical protein
MPAIGRIIEHARQVRLLRKTAAPLAVFMDKPAQLPRRQFDLDQGQGRVGPGAGCNQLIDPRAPASPVDFPASLSNDAVDEIARERRRPLQLVCQPVEPIVVRCIEQHDDTPSESVLRPERWAKRRIEARRMQRMPHSKVVKMRGTHKTYV